MKNSKNVWKVDTTTVSISYQIFSTYFVWKHWKNVIHLHLIRAERHEMTRRFSHYPIKLKNSRWELKTLACAHLNETVHHHSPSSEHEKFHLSCRNRVARLKLLRYTLRQSCCKTSHKSWLSSSGWISWWRNFLIFLPSYQLTRGFSTFRSRSTFHHPIVPPSNAAQNSSSSLLYSTSY